MKRKELGLEDFIARCGYDPFLLSRVQPQGGINFAKDDKFISTGDGYIACLHVYDYPIDIDLHWLANITNIPNTITTIDISTDNVEEVKRNINKSLREQKVRFQSASDYQEQYDAQHRYQELEEIYNEIASMGEVMKILQARIFVAAKTWKDLDEAVKNISIQLESNNFKAAIFLNEQKNEWKSLYQSYTLQQKQTFKTIGQPITSNTVAVGYPFHFSSMQDEFGTLLGYTPCNGIVLFDEFMKTRKRTSYNTVVFGKMGYGKSTLLKKRFADRATRGDFVRAFDISGEFKSLTESYGGRVLTLDGQDGIFNILEVLKAGDSEPANYRLHISKLCTVYKFLIPNAAPYEVMAFERCVNDLYQKFGFIKEDGSIAKQMTGLPAKAYPIFSDLLTLVKEKVKDYGSKRAKAAEMEIVKQDIIIYSNVEKTIENIIDSYGALFNGYTSFNNIQDMHIVTFDLSSVKNLKENIFDALLFSTLSLCWDNAVTNGSLMKAAYEKGEIALEDVVHTIIIFDESHRLFNTRKMQAVDQITVFLREGRKYFCGIWFASQSARDYIPEGASDDNINRIKNLFELAQYKFIFNQDSNMLPMLNDIFGSQLTENEISTIPFLEQGDTILVISSDRNIQFNVKLTKEEEELFKGGA